MGGEGSREAGEQVWGHRGQRSSPAELMGSLEGGTETEAGAEGPESTWVQLGG